MKTYKITRKATLHQIDFQAKNFKELIELYNEGVVDEVLSEKKGTSALQNY